MLVEDKQINGKMQKWETHQVSNPPPPPLCTYFSKLIIATRIAKIFPGLEYIHSITAKILIWLACIHFVTAKVLGRTKIETVLFFLFRWARPLGSYFAATCLHFTRACLLPTRVGLLRTRASLSLSRSRRAGFFSLTTRNFLRATRIFSGAAGICFGTTRIFFGTAGIFLRATRYFFGAAAIF